MNVPLSIQVHPLMLICLKTLKLGHLYKSHERLFENFDQFGLGKGIENAVVSCSVRLYATPVAKSLKNDMMYLLYLCVCVCVCVLKKLFYDINGRVKSASFFLLVLRHKFYVS